MAKSMAEMIQPVETNHSPETLARRALDEPGFVLLRTSHFDQSSARYSFVTCRPFLTFRSFGSRCEIRTERDVRWQYGDPWHLLDRLLERYELLDEPDFPFPLGGCFGFWGYDLKNFVEPKLSSQAVDDLELPDCQVGFYDSLVVFDHHLKKCSIISTGLLADGSREEEQAARQEQFWRELLEKEPSDPVATLENVLHHIFHSNVSASDFIISVRKAQE